MDMEYKIFQMEMYTRDTIFMENLMEMVNITGLMAQHTKDNLKMELEKVMEFGQATMAINMLDILAMIEKMDLVSIFGQMAITIKEILVRT